MLKPQTCLSKLTLGDPCGLLHPLWSWRDPDVFSSKPFICWIRYKLCDGGKNRFWRRLSWIFVLQRMIFFGCLFLTFCPSSHWTCMPVWPSVSLVVTHKLCKHDDVQLLDSKGVALERLASAMNFLPQVRIWAMAARESRIVVLGNCQKSKHTATKTEGNNGKPDFCKTKRNSWSRRVISTDFQSSICVYFRTPKSTVWTEGIKQILDDCGLKPSVA